MHQIPQGTASLAIQENANITASNFEFFEDEQKVLFEANKRNAEAYHNQEGWNVAVRRGHEERMNAIENRLEKVEQEVVEIKTLLQTLVGQKNNAAN